MEGTPSPGEPRRRSTVSSSSVGAQVSLAPATDSAEAGLSPDCSSRCAAGAQLWRRCVAVGCAACDADDGTPVCAPGCRPCCAASTEALHGSLERMYAWAGQTAAHEGALLAAALVLLVLTQVLVVETLPHDVQLQAPSALRRSLATLFFFTDAMFFILVVAIARHLVPNVHTRLAVRYAAHL